MAILEVQNLKVNYGVIEAIKGVSFQVEKGEIIALIGANGAGKTTIMHAVNGLLPVKEGKIFLDGEDITNIPAHKLISKGLTQVPEGRRIFQELTVLDNLLLGAYTRKDKKESRATLESVYEKFPILSERNKQIAGTLSGGEQQMLAMGRALMSRPRVLLLDEPSMGLSPLYVNEVFKIIKEINEAGTTVLLVEQNAKKALSVANRAYVLETGRIVLSGDAKELMYDENIKKAYLGE